MERSTKIINNNMISAFSLAAKTIVITSFRELSSCSNVVSREVMRACPLYDINREGVKSQIKTEVLLIKIQKVTQLHVKCVGNLRQSFY